VLDYGAKTVQRGDTAISITPIEFDFLAMLTRYAGQVIERDRLFRDVLDRPPEPLDRTVDVHISNLRRKLGPDDSGANRIKSIRGVGYMYSYPSRVPNAYE
jgi:two-component system response regulator CpxR